MVLAQGLVLTTRVIKTELCLTLNLDMKSETSIFVMWKCISELENQLTPYPSTQIAVYNQFTYAKNS